MKISDLLKMGLRNLRRRKARTILTILGVVIGSLFIIITISIGEGVKHNFDKQLKEYGGYTTITINTHGDVFDENGNYVESKQQKLDESLVEQLKGMKHVKAVTPVINMSANLYSGKYQSWAHITAMDSDTFEAFEFPALSMGEYPTNEDKSVIIFGSSQLSNFYDPYSRSRVWTPIEIDLKKDKISLKFEGRYQPNPRKKEFSLPLKNIAMMEETMSEFDWNTYMDLDYFKEIYLKYCNTLSLEDRKKAVKEIQEFQEIRVGVDNIDNVQEVQDKITELGYTSTSRMQWIQPLIKSSDSLQFILLFLGIVTMVVSAISIANTMVMAIYERMKEIGIMKVLGCVITDIRMLFLYEAALIGLFGGILGNVFAYIASIVINKYGAPLFSALSPGGMAFNMTEETTYSIIPFYLPFVAMGISIGVALLAGYFPARRATKISAIEAMKTEG
ncbi:ABC transporter permease [Mobilitalea sibirica]|uniref:ABC transporter permease n=1 Tax=Mobilitalea sibirica TaxID=1462919 RepID=A0A8J7KWS2_9FIRM|nr:FtsX-like permease family protein [Mobilitalea sibirica]MBH1941695.1 ABC transporter permease [Mobilitalea sibirica]